MAQAFEITDETQKQRLITALQAAIETDVTSQREDIRAMMAEYAGKLPAYTFTTIEKNLDVNEAVYRKLIEDIKKRDDYPITLEKFLGQFQSSFAGSFADGDPLKPEYTFLLTHIIPPGQLDEQTRKKGQAMTPKGKQFMGVVHVPAHKHTDEYVANTGARADTIHHTALGALDSFYEGATGKKGNNDRDPDYLQFKALRDFFLIGPSGPYRQ